MQVDAGQVASTGMVAPSYVQKVAQSILVINVEYQIF